VIDSNLSDHVTGKAGPYRFVSQLNRARISLCCFRHYSVSILQVEKPIPELLLLTDTQAVETARVSPKTFTEQVCFHP
jgi:hypothetical protein